MEEKVFCERCGMYHMNLIKITDEEILSLRLLAERKDTAQRYLKDPAASATVVTAALQLEADANNQISMWWDKAAETYGFDRQAHEFDVDFINKEIYYQEGA